MPHRCKSRPLPRRHRHFPRTRPRPGAGLRPRHPAGNPEPPAARRAAPLWPRSRNRFRGHGARRKTLARQTRPAQRPDRTGAVMILLLVVLWVTIPLLALVTFVQVLYLESLRLRTRDLPSLKFFKETLEDRIGIPTEDGAGAFSLVKHTLLCGLGILYFAWFADDAPWHAAVLWQAVAAVVLTMIAVSFALPQLLSRRTSGRWLLPLVPLLRLFALIARPCVALLKFFQSLIDLTDDAVSPADEPTSAENIEALISADATLEQLRQLVITEQYSRIPVYEQSIDRVIGFIHVRDMFELEGEEREHGTVRELVRTIRVGPETKPVSDLMRQMQQENSHMVIVVDEYGNTAGLATMEDLLEVIIGEIRDEHEPDSDVTEDGHGGFIVSGSFELNRIGDLFRTFHREEDIESTTVGGLVSEWLGHVPKAGESADRDGVRIEVLASDEFRVEKVRLSKSQTVAHE